MPRFTSDMLIQDALLAHPGAAGVFESVGLPCAHCLASSMETLGEVSEGHDVDVATLLESLNALAATEREEV